VLFISGYFPIFPVPEGQEISPLFEENFRSWKYLEELTRTPGNLRPSNDPQKSPPSPTVTPKSV
jgi:hypothetical protein